MNGADNAAADDDDEVVGAVAVAGAGQADCGCGPVFGSWDDVYAATQSIVAHSELGPTRPKTWLSVHN